MTSKKNKAASKLKSLKEDEISNVEDENLLDVEIPFDGKDEQSGAADDILNDVLNFNVEENADGEDPTASVFTTSSSQKNYAEREDGASDMEHGEEGTDILTDNQYDKTDVASADINESTYREITTGRSGISQESERVSYGDVYENDTMSPMQAQSVDGILKQSEHLRIAQDKINDLEKELDELRRQNHELSNDAESIATLNEAYSGQIENLKMELTHIRLTLSEEVKILRHSMHEKERLLNEMKQSNSDLKSKVESNFKSIRKRERDLEYRLELAKVDEAALLKSKDKMILDLRREVEKKEQERTAFERKNKEHFQKIQEQQQTVRTVVRALRIALTRLEGDFGVDFEVLKKAE
ncbi:MAG: hypothetical protein IT287_03310 [Bdellovibrionaceae bacterium]|nr:hypothetical protein [Pseudobdellovibrionaceae bacterium]